VGIVSNAYFFDIARAHLQRGGRWWRKVDAHVKPVDLLTPARKADTICY
jgi:hypothetical protein